MEDTQQHFCIFGRLPVIEAFKAGKRFDKILLLKNIMSDEIRQIQQFARDTETPLQLVPKEKLESVARKYSKFKEANHQGVIGFRSIIEYYSLEDVLHNIYAKGDTPLLVVLDGITDVGNFGAIARSAECLGAHALIVPSQGSAQINSEAMKASAGALNKILVCREKSLVTAIKFLQVNGIRVFGADMKHSNDLSNEDFSVPCAIVLGSEGDGISKEVARLCDEKICIPMRGSTASLNVSVSAGIILHEINRSRSKRV
ncbi:MAG: 23S rRNA (guanosine(2251)-2'-O)-methyltransferase RlmB [Bacteroidetes bacterium]|nr:23S rRNA (guanosine(2251)-2'-O)-methyltransferase RlmB [Bacteroidota bacterium]